MKNVLEVMGDTCSPFTANLALTLGIPAILAIVPMAIVGVPTWIVAFLVAGGTAMVNKGAVALALIPVGITAAVAFAAVYNAIRVGWTRVMLKTVNNEPCSFQEMANAFAWYLKFLAVCVMIGLATMIGTLLLIVPGIYIAVRTCLAPFLVVDQNMGPVEALLKSNEMVTGYGWQVLLYFLIYGVTNLIAGAVPLLGFFLLIPIMGFFDLVLAEIYVMLKGRASSSYAEA